VADFDFLDGATGGAAVVVDFLAFFGGRSKAGLDSVSEELALRFRGMAKGKHGDGTARKLC
jgi:hypothetical protein